MPVKTYFLVFGVALLAPISGNLQSYMHLLIVFGNAVLFNSLCDGLGARPCGHDGANILQFEL